MIYDYIGANKRDSYLLFFFFIVIVGVLGYVFGLYIGVGEYAIIPAVLLATLMSWGSYYYSDSIVLQMSQARPVTKEEEPYLYNSVEALSIGAGMPTPKAYIIEDSAPNAFATGRDPEHAVVCVTRGLLDKLDKLELEGVLAHEMSHIRNYDIRFMMLVSVLLGTIALLSDWMLRSMRFGGRRRSRSSSGSGGAIILVLMLVCAILAPIIAQLMRFALSRKREFLADSSGALLTRYPEGLASALEKIAKDTEPLEVANKATAHLYIYNPLRDHGGWVNSLFSTHPPVEERIRRLRSM